jgi:hypothetical protein
LALIFVTGAAVPTTDSVAAAAVRESISAVVTGATQVADGPSSEVPGVTGPADTAGVASGTPVVNSISPSTVSAGGGATVTIVGSGFEGVTAVYFGPNASSSVSVVSPTQINAVAPTNAGTVHVTVDTPMGASANTSADQLTYAPTGQLPITASGQSLEVGGIPTQFTGVNAYELATAWGTNNGCGSMESPAQIAALFASLGPGSLVRFWAFQGDFATDVSTGAIDWAPLDQVFYLAALYDVYLVPTITDQGGTCDGGHWQGPSWYDGGYRGVFNSPEDSDGAGLTPLSYWNYMSDLVNRYKNSPALGMWEPISEAEPSSCAAQYQPDDCPGNQTCPDEATAAADLISFFNIVGGEIHSLDPNHLVEEGLLGSGQCGTAGADYAMVGASAGIDVLSVHDYYGTVALGGDTLNGLRARFAQAVVLDKPIITGEVGILAGTAQGCDNFAAREVAMAAKLREQFALGASAFLVWNWVPGPLGPCSYNTGPGDPLVGLLADPSSGS